MVKQLIVERSKTVILLLDYQNRMLSKLAESPQKEILKKANAILSEARRIGIPIIYEVRGGERIPEREIHLAIAPKAGELVLTTQRTGPFTTTNLDEVLKKQNVDTLVLMGIPTSGCVLTTVRFAADMDYKLIVVSDCCAVPQDDELHRVLIEKVFPHQSMVVTSQEILDVLGKI